ncbi:hypothetical protein HSISB1_2044 [Streptococcus sp. HSISB1]|nr:hypothetical protein HSISB1_2044 [Streptococcus sp. HSISB1]
MTCAVDNVAGICLSSLTNFVALKRAVLVAKVPIPKVSNRSVKYPIQRPVQNFSFRLILFFLAWRKIFPKTQIIKNTKNNWIKRKISSFVIVSIISNFSKFVNTNMTRFK